MFGFAQPANFGGAPSFGLGRLGFQTFDRARMADARMTDSAGV